MDLRCYNTNKTPIGRNSVIPFTNGTVDNINNVLENSLSNYTKDNYIVKDDEVDDGVSNYTYTVESYK